MEVQIHKGSLGVGVKGIEGIISPSYLRGCEKRRNSQESITGENNAHNTRV
jgi:hypothetical protein